MSIRGAIAFAGSAAVASSLDGVARSLTAAPPALTLCTGFALLILSLRVDNSTHAIAWRTWSVAALSGGCAGLSLLCTTPSAPRDVNVRVPRNHIAADLFDALDRLDADPAAFDRHIIDVTGTWTPSTEQGAATISRRVMSCCAADAIDVGFDVISTHKVPVSAGTWARVSGRVRVQLRDGELRYEIGDATVRRAPLR